MLSDHELRRYLELSRGVDVHDPMRKRKRGLSAVTLDGLGGEAASRVSFVRTDARAAVATTASRTKLKEAFDSDLEPQWATFSGDAGASVLRLLGVEDANDATPTASSRRNGFCLGHDAVARALSREKLSAVILAREAGSPLLVSHLAVLAQERGIAVCMLAHGSAQLGQPSGLLRASAIGLRAESFGADHELVRLLRASQAHVSAKARAAADGAEAEAAGLHGPLQWLGAARAARAIRTGEPA